MNTNSIRIVHLLHEARTHATLTSEQSSEIASIISTATDAQVAQGTAAYFADILIAKVEVKRFERDALVSAIELQDAGGMLH